MKMTALRLANDSKPFISAFFILTVSAVLSSCAHSPEVTAESSPFLSSVHKEGPQAQVFDPELTRYSYPRPVHFREFESQKQRLKMAYMDVKPDRPNGEAVLLLHGKNFSGAYWAPTIRALAEKGYRIIVPDQIGFGKSSKPASYQFSFQALAKNTADLLDSVGVRQVSVVGHSMGGMLATRFALMYPDRIRKLALVNPIGLEDWKTMVPYRSVDELYQQELKATPDSIREYQRLNYFGGNWKPEYEPLVEVLSGWTRHPDYPRVAWNAALTAEMIFTQPVLYEFPLVRVPTLLIIGQKDRTAIGKAWASEEVRPRMGDYPTLGRKTARSIPGSKLVEITQAGHLPQVEAFDEYIRALASFLAGGK